MEICQENLTHRIPAYKVAGTDACQSATYDFLLVVHSNHGPISYRFRDKRRFRSKMGNFHILTHL